MKFLWLQVLNSIAKTGNRQITAKALNISPSLVHQIARRSEAKLGIVLFHRMPWVNQTRERLWDVADDRARTIFSHIDAMSHALTMTEETAFIITRQNPDGDVRLFLRARDIERVLVLNGNSIKFAAQRLGDKESCIAASLKKIERWLGITVYSGLQSGHEKLRVLTQDGKVIFPYLEQINAHYQDILELCR